MSVVLCIFIHNMFGCFSNIFQMPLREGSKHLWFYALFMLCLGGFWKKNSDERKKTFPPYILLVIIRHNI